jgi:hypothetical protein
MRKSMLVVMVGVKWFVAGNALAGATDLALRCEPATCTGHGSTTQTIETSFGASVAGLAFTGTTTYDFYSPPLVMATALTTREKAAGTIFMENSGASSADDFVVNGGMQYYDYDPLTGVEVLIVGATNSDNQVVTHGETVNWDMDRARLSAAHIVPVGHLLHIAVTITLVSGSPGSFGQLLYNGPSGSTTVGVLPDNRPAKWTFAKPGTPVISLCKTPGSCARLNCAAIPNSTYSIQATTNLIAPVWTTIATATAGPNGVCNFTDLDSTNYPCRFYRISAP